MNLHSPGRILFVSSACLFLALAFALHVGAQPAGPRQEEKTVSLHAAGTFEVKLTPQPADPAVAGAEISRFLLEKQFHGGLEATSQGQMLAFGGAQKGSGGYVAIERVTGTLDGRTGSFALQHSGRMQPGATQLSIAVIPGSGTGQLAGLAGSMNIVIEAGKHSYTFDFTLPGV